jgi:Monogalactosyldiacylglycerol (MGDG) synthase
MEETMTALLSTTQTKEKFSINIITGQGGGGHYAAYRAICAIAEQYQLPWQIDVTDMDDIITELAQQNKVANAYEMMGFSGHDLYNLMLKSGWTWLWWLKMRLNKFLVKLNYQAGLEFFEQYWRDRQPDLVVSVMPLYNKGLSESLQKAKPGTPYITVPVDFADYPPAFWYEPQTDNYTVCPTQKAIEQARSLGVKEELIVPFSGLVIHPRFYEPCR